MSRHKGTYWDVTALEEVAIQAEVLWKDSKIVTERWLWNLRKRGFQVYIFSYRKSERRMDKKFEHCVYEEVRRFKDKYELRDWLGFKYEITHVFLEDPKHIVGDKGRVVENINEVIDILRGVIDEEN